MIFIKSKKAAFFMFHPLTPIALVLLYNGVNIECQRCMHSTYYSQSEHVVFLVGWSPLTYCAFVTYTSHDLTIGVIHKPRGHFLCNFTLPHLWSLLLNKAYVIKLSFGYPLPPLNCPRGLWMTQYQKGRECINAYKSVWVRGGGKGKPKLLLKNCPIQKFWNVKNQLF